MSQEKQNRRKEKGSIIYKQTRNKMKLHKNLKLKKQLFQVKVDETKPEAQISREESQTNICKLILIMF